MQVLVATALQSGALNAAEVGYIAMHGTGTPLGDPIEVGALAGALGKQGQLGVPALTLGSVKASHLHIHHTLAPSKATQCWS